MPKLTDTQLVILSAAAQRDDGAILPLPDSLKVKGGARTKVLASLLDKGLIEERPAPAGAEIWREAADGARLSLAITAVGLDAIRVGSSDKAGAKDTVPRPKPQKPAKATTKSSEATGARTGTKLAQLTDLLKRKRGATIDEAAAATGWQAHSVRGAISGALRKKLGLDVTSEKVEGRGRVYRIVSD